MFSKTERNNTSSAAGSAGSAKAAPSIISVNLHIIGNLNTDGEMQIDGRIDGNITSQSLTVGQEALITGEIVSENLEVHGTVSGKIRAGKIKLAKTAKVVGDICHEVLSIEPGACIEGQLTRAETDLADREIPRPVEVTAAPELAAQSASGGEAPAAMRKATGS